MHRDEIEQATRKELLELQARHRGLQASMRDREAQRFAGSDLAKAAEGTPSYAAVLKEQAKAKERQVESLQTRVTALMRTTTKASHREAMLLQDRQAMQDQIA